MQVLLRKVSRGLYNRGLVVGNWRAKRMQAFLELVRPPSGARIVDLGGSAYNWNLIPHDFEVTLVNRPGDSANAQGTGALRLVEADACNLKDVFESDSFDVVFSNSVIEHVGDEARQAQFRDEVLRLAPSHWVQTPSDRFPIEPHTGVPYYWRLPKPVVRRLNEGWQRKLPEWSEMVRGTRVLTRERMGELFPTSKFYTERVLGLEKSYAAYQPYG